MESADFSHQPGQRGLAAARRSPQDRRHQPVLLHHPAQRRVGGQQPALTHHVIETRGPQSVGERSLVWGGVAEQALRHAMALRSLGRLSKSQSPKTGLPMILIATIHGTAVHFRGLKTNMTTLISQNEM